MPDASGVRCFDPENQNPDQKTAERKIVSFPKSNLQNFRGMRFVIDSPSPRSGLSRPHSRLPGQRRSRRQGAS
eukprot:967942-Amorphochlora_amoeboformis.AAC.1